MKTTKESIMEELSAAIDDIMFRAEEREGCPCGDITPPQVWAIGDALDGIADVLLKVIEQNKPNN
jgi:hypothetical protein